MKKVAFSMVGRLWNLEFKTALKTLLGGVL